MPAETWVPHRDHELVCAGPGAPRTAGDLRRDVAALAARLGPQVEERAVACKGRYAFAVALLACWERGEAAALPLNHAPEVLGALAAAGPLLHDGHAPSGLDVRDALGRGGPRAALPRPPAHRRVLRLSTSGSTGEVRWHDKLAGQILGESDALGAVFGLGPGHRLVATIPPHHIYGLLFSIVLPLRHGGAFNDDAPLFPEAVAARLREMGATVLVSVPAHLRVLAAAPEGALPGVRVVFSSGAPLPAATAEALATGHGLEVTEVFGSTETGGIGWRRQREDEAWRCLPGVRVGADREGRLLLDSPFVHPDEPRPRPGDDRIEPLDGGRFRHLGRLDDVVKVASKRVPLGAVEHLLLEQPGVLDAAVVAVDDGERQRLEALVVGDADLPTVREALARRLDRVAVPRLHRVAALPREPNGKLPRARVLATLASLRGSTRSVAVQVPADHPAFQGHFPGDPVLPGVVLLGELVLPEVERAWPDLVPVGELRRVRFLRPIRPGDALVVGLTRDGVRVRFEVRRGDEVVGSGALGPTARR